MTAEQYQLQQIVAALNDVATRLDGIDTRQDEFESTADDTLRRLARLEESPSRERAVRRVEREMSP